MQILNRPHRLKRIREARGIDESDHLSPIKLDRQHLALSRRTRSGAHSHHPIIIDLQQSREDRGLPHINFSHHCEGGNLSFRIAHL